MKKWTDFKMHCTTQLQPWQLCAGDSRTVESLARLEWRVLVWHGGKLVSCPCGCDTEKAEPIAQPLKSRMMRLLSGLTPTLWFVSGRGLYLTVSSDSSMLFNSRRFSQWSKLQQRKYLFSFCVSLNLKNLIISLMFSYMEGLKEKIFIGFMRKFIVNKQYEWKVIFQGKKKRNKL